MRKRSIILLFLLIHLQVSAQRVTYKYDFSAGDHGWVSDISDYSPYNHFDLATGEWVETVLHGPQFESVITPNPVDGSYNTLRLSGNNVSADLFMFSKKKLNLPPCTTFRVEMQVSFLSKTSKGLVGGGCAPAECVTVKAGVVGQEPVKTLLEYGDDVPAFMDNYFLNIDKGNNGQDGADTENLGDVGKNGDYGVINGLYESVVLDNSSHQPFMFTTNENGEAWLIVGTDSGFTGENEMYYTEFEFSFTPISLDISEDNGMVTLTWDYGTLETCPDLSGWVPMTGAQSPFTYNSGFGMRYWRVRQ